MNDSLLTAELKQSIQSSYRTWLGARKFRPRRGQREMIAHISKTLTADAPRIIAVEAGTGTGKTAAYCMAAIPIARALDKTVVISTATVALQEQVVLRDLPDLAEHADIQFTYALAKGRGRYLCLKRLDDQLRYSDQAEIPMFEEVSADGVVLYQAMLNAFSSRAWNGERDTWSEGLDVDLWRAVTTDHRGCGNNKCSFFRQCPFFRARAELDGVDVIVANHDLLLADLSLGGGAVLPEPEDCIYIVDEAHHLPEKTQQHFSVSARIRGTSQWVDSVSSVLGSLTQRFGRPDPLVHHANSAAIHAANFAGAWSQLGDCLTDLEFTARDENLATHRFVLGEVPHELAQLAKAALDPIGDLRDDIRQIHELLQKAFAGELDWEKGFEAEHWLPAVGQLETRALATIALLTDYAAQAAIGSTDAARENDFADDAPGLQARWVNDYGADLEVVSAPLQPGKLLHDSIWARCYGAVCTSATLTSLGRFERFFERAGLDEVAGVRIPSPFDFQSIASFTVPEMHSDPRNFSEHSVEVAALLPGLLEDDPSALVLFTSWRQMHEVVGRLPVAFREKLKIQGEGSKQALLLDHRRSVDAGERSYIIGLASFAEGVDLPDDYCRHVVIVKLPFAVPDDPVDQAMAEWVEARGRNAFYEISVPDAALKLVQACGRLIRHERDFGRITLLDRRIVTQRYGRALLDSLPPYQQNLNRA
ncbi:MAG: ATP-dependent DNA helicase DinG [Gammaproteobacteria bacterium]|nr:ATP-dependent DNA helicase DinG [Gammaproteobacteria bacterium]